MFDNGLLRASLYNALLLHTRVTRLNQTICMINSNSAILYYVLKWAHQHHGSLPFHSTCMRSVSVAVPKYSVVPTVSDAALPHSFFSYCIMWYITSSSTNGSKLYYALLIHSWLSYIQTLSYSIICWYGGSSIMLAFPSIPCWDWSMIGWPNGWGRQNSKADRGRGVRALHLFFSVLYQSTLSLPL